MATLYEATQNIVSSACQDVPIGATDCVDSEESFADAIAEYAGRTGQPGILGHRSVARAQVRKWLCFAHSFDATLATDGYAYFPAPVQSTRGKVTVPSLMMMEIDDRLRGRKYICLGGSVEASHRDTHPTIADYAMLAVAL